jgi:hypothetical protein
VDESKWKRELTSLRSGGKEPAIIPIPDSAVDQRTIYATLSGLVRML